MTNETLAGYANLSLYSAMAVFTIAMVCHAVYLAGLVPSRDARAVREAQRELVGAGPATATADSTVDGTETAPAARASRLPPSSPSWARTR